MNTVAGRVFAQESKTQPELSSRLEPIVSLGDETVRAWELLARPIPKSRELWRLFYEQLPSVVRYIRRHQLITQTSPLTINVDTWQIGDRVIMNAITSMSFENIAIEWTERVSEWVDSRNVIDSPGAYLQQVSSQTGIPVWIDDAGTGLDALRRISESRPAAIKISGELFVKAMADAYTHDLLALLLEMAGRVGSLSVIEHIESNEQARVAKQMGADCGQGFLWHGKTISHAKVRDI